MLAAVGLATGFGPADAVMVGDTTHDVEMAHAWGCRAVGMTYGAMPAEMLKTASPEFLCGSVEELARVLGVKLS